MTRFFKLLPAALALLVACSDAEPQDAQKPVKNTDADTAVMYALMIRDPEGYTDYLMADEQVPTGTIDTARGIELPGGNYYSDSSATYYDNFETKTLQRYVVDRSLEVQLDGEISLANYIGVTPIFFSDEKAYGVCVDDGLLFEFNPTTMEIVREIPAPELIRKNYTGEINRMERVGDRIIGSIVYTNEDFTKPADDSTIAIAIDADSDAPLEVLRDDRAVSTDNGFVDKAGNFYVLAEATGGYFSLVEGQDIQPKLLRVKKDADEVDRDYLLDLGELFDTPAVNGLWPLEDTKFVLQVWREAKDSVSDADQLDVKPFWEWYIVDAETRETKQIEELGRSTTSYSLLRFIVDGELYLQQYVVPDENYNNAHIEIHKLAKDGKTKKIVESRRGDMRSMTRVKISD